MHVHLYTHIKSIELFVSGKKRTLNSTELSQRRKTVNKNFSCLRMKIKERPSSSEPLARPLIQRRRERNPNSVQGMKGTHGLV